MWESGYNSNICLVWLKRYLVGYSGKWWKTMICMTEIQLLCMRVNFNWTIDAVFTFYCTVYCIVGVDVTKFFVKQNQYIFATNISPMCFLSIEFLGSCFVDSILSEAILCKIWRKKLWVFVFVCHYFWCDGVTSLTIGFGRHLGHIL